MIVIDQNDEINGFLERREEYELATVRLDPEIFERANGLEGDLVVVHSECVLNGSEVFLAKLRKQKMLAVFEKSPLDKKTFPTNAVLDFGPQSDADRVCQQLAMLEEGLKQTMVLKSQLLTINRELADTLGTVETELLRVKKAHEEGRPKRFQNIKGISALSKYAAGDSVGGEFFDLFKSQGKIFLMMSETSSYLASSSILQSFSDFKIAGDLSVEKELALLSEIKEEAVQINSSKKKKALKVNILTAVIDLNTYTVKGHVFGEFKALSSGHDKNFTGNKLDFLQSPFEQGSFTWELSRGERLLLLSPGFCKNWEEVSPDLMIETLMNNKKIKLLDILDEIFFQLKKDAKSGFLAHDASAIMLEVQKNVMLKV